MATLILPRETTRVPRTMSPETIYVAPLSLVETTVAGANVSHLVTLINGETLIDTPPGIGPDRHLRLAMNDICEPQPGLVLPCESHVADLVRFAREEARRFFGQPRGLSASLVRRLSHLSPLPAAQGEAEFLKRFNELRR